MSDLEKELGFETKKEGTVIEQLSKQEPTPESKLNRTLPELVNILISKGIKVYLTHFGYEIEGFYRLGSISLIPDYQKNVLVAVDKKDDITEIKNFDDLVRLNYAWWKKSYKKVQFSVPEKIWEDEFLKLNLIKRQYTYTPNE